MDFSGIDFSLYIDKYYVTVTESEVIGLLALFVF